MYPKIGDEHILLGFNRGLYAGNEKPSHPDDLAASHLNTLSINMKEAWLDATYLATGKTYQQFPLLTDMIGRSS